MDVLEALAAIEREPLSPNGSSSLGEQILSQQIRRDELIVQARERGYSLESVAKAAGVSRRHVCQVLEWASTS